MIAFINFNSFFKEKQKPAACGHQQKQQEMEVDEEDEEEEEGEDGQKENEAEENNEGENEGGECQDGPIEEGKLEQQQQEEKRQGSMSIEKTTETPLENEVNPREDTLEEQLHKAIAKVYKWMAGIEPNQIGPTLEGWDNSSLLKMVEMADQEIKQHPEKFII
jgi:hypothetical protein